MFSSLAYWVHNLDPFVVRFPDGWPTDGIRWYGLAYLMGFLVGWALLHLYYKKGRSPLNLEAQANLMTYLILGVLVGGRLGYCLLYALPEWSRDPLLILRVWEGGMASHGGFLGVIIALIIFAKRNHLPFTALGDIVVTLVPPGLLFGRIANFINGELWGKLSDAPWAVIFPKSAPPGIPVEFIAARHPSQLYEALLEGLLLLILTQWLFWRKNPSTPHNGQLSGIFLITYALVRILCECFREPDATLILGLSRGTFYSLFLILLGALFIWNAWRHGKKGKSFG